jgi:hypothetical protein
MGTSRGPHNGDPTTYRFPTRSSLIWSNTNVLRMRLHATPCVHLAIALAPLLAYLTERAADCNVRHNNSDHLGLLLYRKSCSYAVASQRVSEKASDCSGLRPAGCTAVPLYTSHWSLSKLYVLYHGTLTTYVDGRVTFIAIKFESIAMSTCGFHRLNSRYCGFPTVLYVVRTFTSIIALTAALKQL